MELFALTVLAVLCIFAGSGAYGSAQKNRVPVENALLGGLLSSIGLLIAVLLPRIATTKPQRRSGERGSWTPDYHDDWDHAPKPKLEDAVENEVL
jgi:hypothetical protein